MTQVSEKGTWCMHWLDGCVRSADLIMGEYNSDSIHKMSVSVQFFTQIVSEKLLQNCILLLDQKSVVLTHELTDMRPAKYIKKRKVEKGK
jgi:hypothetical protein